jgi:hypothetical protein
MTRHLTWLLGVLGVLGVVGGSAVLRAEQRAESASLRAELDALKAKSERSSGQETKGSPSRLSSSEAGAIYDAEFRGQALDIEWTQRMDQRVRAEALPELAKKLPGVALDSIECRDTMCRVIVVHDTPQSQRPLASTVARIPPFQEANVYYVYEHGTPLRTVMYVMRRGQN